MNDDRTKTCGAFGALLIGGLLGAAVALLYAPKSGRETRKDIRRAARYTKNRAADLIEDTIDNVNDLVKDLKERAADIVDRGADLSDKARKEIIARLEQAQKTIEEQKQKFSDKV